KGCNQTSYIAQNWLERQTNEKIKKWHMDREGENRSSKLEKSVLQWFTRTAVYEKTFGRKPTVADLRVLKCLAYTRILPKDHPLEKLNTHAVKGRFIGYSCYDGQLLQTKGNPDSVVMSRNVYFVEDQFDTSKSLPLSHPLIITKRDDHHDDATDFDIVPSRA
ncbi:hypothetical protein HDU67_002118, partial [Dinochytrium kinnereticum]